MIVCIYHLDGGGEGHRDLFSVIGEHLWGCDLDLPGLGGGLSVEVSCFPYIDTSLLYTYIQTHYYDIFTVYRHIIIHTVYTDTLL